MALSIRLGTVEDAVMIADISRQTFYETFAADNKEEDMKKFLDEQFTRGKLILEVGQKENTFLLAYSDNELAGYVKLRDSRSPFPLRNLNALEIARIYVLEKNIGKKIGAALMQASLDFAKKKSKEVVWLGVWEKNLRAIEFYQRWGFEKFDETDFLLGNDVQRDWLMKKEF